MKDFIVYINEKLKITKNISKQNKYNYHPKTRDELEKLVFHLIDERGEHGDLNDIDTSEIRDMSEIFMHTNFNGDISEWNVGKVKNMELMFSLSKFTGENGDISRWNVSSVEKMNSMFSGSNFNQDISKWDVSNVIHYANIFFDCPIKDEYRPKFNK